jgi:hypothetical protein
MDFPAILARLNDVPSTFKRDGPPYTQFVDSIASALAIYTNSSDATAVQVQSFPAAVDGWLDVWGLLWGVPRNADEANSPYATRITRTVLAWVGTLPALQQWAIFYAPGASVTENANGLGYNITLPPILTTAQVAEFLQSLNRIRPAGIPFSASQIGGGLFLGTVEFLGKNTVQGSYLTSGVSDVNASLSASTPNSVPLLPTLLFTDPTINPVYAPSS